MKRLIFILFAASSTLQAQNPNGREILQKIDDNLSSQNRIFTSSMIVNGSRTSHTVKMKTWTSGTTKSYTEYLFPVRDEGTKMLKLDNQLWIYSPSTDRIIQIAGHMLRQSVMGSDLSYEDLMEDKKLTENYNAVVTGSEEIDGKSCWVLELNAFTTGVAYQKLKIWVDRERFTPLRQEMYAKSGALLKRTELSDVRKIGSRWYPMKIVFKDMLREGKGTEFITEEIEFNANIPDYIFSKGSLKK